MEHTLLEVLGVARGQRDADLVEGGVDGGTFGLLGERHD